MDAYMRNAYGDLIVVWKPRRRTLRITHKRRCWRPYSLHVESALRWYRLRWTPHVGWECSASGTKGRPVTEPTTLYPTTKDLKVKRRNAPAAGGIIQPALPAASVMLGKLPCLREFLTATAYEDGSPRVPGYITIRNRQVTFEATIYDVDSGTRLSARAAKLDDVLALLEQLLGVEEAPWEIDSYLTEQLARRSKKQKKSS